MKKFIYYFSYKTVEHKGEKTESEEKKGTIHLVAPTMIIANRMFDSLYASQSYEGLLGSVLGGKTTQGVRAAVAGTPLHVYKVEETDL